MAGTEHRVLRACERFCLAYAEGCRLKGKTGGALTVAMLLSICISAPLFAAPLAPDRVAPAGRELQRLQDDIDRYRQSQEVRQMQERRDAMEAEQTPKPEKAPQADFHFELKAVEHNESEVLSNEEIDEAVRPFIGRDVSVSDLQSMLEAINTRYRAKGYVVCEARLLPQRIRDGKLFVTLVEGKTGEVTVEGNVHTRTGYILDAFDLPEGKVANYRELSSDLVHFNMTNDIELRVDIRAGKKPGTTDYAVTAVEPANWAATVFADTLGTRSTGRPRAGASVTNRSVLGRRDALTLLGMASEGSKSLMASYSMPLTSRGTRLSLSAALGDVEMIQGVSAGQDVTGDSEYYSVRIDHPVYADADSKWTLYGEWSRQKSSTDFFDVTINDTSIDAWRSGFEAILLGDRSVFYVTMGIGHETVKEYTFGERWTQNIFKGNAFWRLQMRSDLRLSLSGAWQSVLGGDPLSTSQYFYLGHTSGVRGYENDVLSAEQGAYANAQIDWAVAGPQTSLFAFFDAGKLGGTSSYKQRELASVGLGVTWPLWSGASVSATAAAPLIRDLDDDMHVNKARFDLSVTAYW